MVVQLQDLEKRGVLAQLLAVQLPARLSIIQAHIYVSFKLCHEAEVTRGGVVAAL